MNAVLVRSRWVRALVSLAVTCAIAACATTPWFRVDEVSDWAMAIVLGLPACVVFGGWVLAVRSERLPRSWIPWDWIASLPLSMVWGAVAYALVEDLHGFDVGETFFGGAAMGLLSLRTQTA